MTEELFHVEYEDGDEGDMNTQEVTEAIALAARRGPSRSRLVKGWCNTR